MSDYQINPKDIELLRSQGMDEEDLDHSIKVAKKSLEIGRLVTAEVDLEFICRGALFHDLGKTVTHGIEHGKKGA